jgi:TolB protein
MRKRRILVALAAPLLVLAWYATEAQEEQRFKTGLYAKVPLSERSYAMGASDPSWSPNGEEIAFSLFGSIWRMPAGGGEARQVTSGTGYDAGAAWSPDGRSIAFVRGHHPIRGIQLGTQGELMVADAATGEARVVAPDVQFTGTPAWTPDAKALVANRVEGDDVFLSEIQVTGGAARRVTGYLSSRVSTQMQRGNAWYYFWYPAAVAPWGELAFGADRDGTGQLWRMPLTDGLVLARKLTRYPETSQTDVQDVAWEDRDSIIYSANLNNDRTNYDLFRWRHGEATRLTTSIHDEFSPRISPDRKAVLFVSNYLGNLDLFTAAPDLLQARHLRIGPLKFRQAPVRLRVSVEDEDGKPIAARISVRGADGKYYSPPGALMRYHPGMGESAGFFHARGDFSLDVPAGPVRVAAYHGIEYEPAVVEAQAQPDTPAVRATVKRRLRWQGNGWWSGEDHIHANYVGPYYLRPDDALVMAEAEDLNVSNLLAANAEGERVYDREFFEGRPNVLSGRQHILYWNEEYRNRIVYGHMALLNLTKMIGPVYTSFAGTPHPWDYPSNTMVAREARNAKALVDYVHPILGGTRDPFDFTVSAKELPVTAALGLVDVVDIYPWGPAALDIWYELLNCGLRIAPGAGTDTFANWRSINQVPGASRVYVRTPGELSYAGWIVGLREGRSFVSNGPLLELTVNGKVPGETVSSAAGQPLLLEVEARVESRVPLDKLELVLNGKVIQSVAAGREGRASFHVSRSIMAGGWLALRASGAADPTQLGAPAEAHTAPIYLEPEGKAMEPMAESAAKFVDWIDRLTDLVELRNNFETPQQKQEVLRLIQSGRDFYSRMVPRKAPQPQ